MAHSVAYKPVYSVFEFGRHILRDERLKRPSEAAALDSNRAAASEKLFAYGKRVCHRYADHRHNGFH